MKDQSRARRVAEQIQRELAELFQTSVKDPRVVLVTVQSVNVSPDKKFARVYVSSLDPRCERDAFMKALKSMAGHLRSGLARRLSRRSVPRLQFYYDDTAEQGAKINQLISAALAEDQSRSLGYVPPDSQDLESK